MSMTTTLNEMTPEQLKTREMVLKFIARFTNNGKRQEVIDTFSCGCCYWFAEILWDRFCFNEPINSRGKIYTVYDPIINHWACCIDYRIYDITGDITDNEEYQWHDWNRFMYEDISLTKRLYRDCINFDGGEEDDLV